MSKGKGRGWHGEPGRHSKAARGIKTGGLTPKERSFRKATQEYLAEMKGVPPDWRWKEFGTGAGCTALIHREPDGKYWLMTDWDDLTLPVVGRHAALGLYDVDGIQLGLWYIPIFSSYRKNDLKPITKAIINGVYIGLSGLAFLERGEVYRNAALLLREYEQRLFTDEEIEFLRQVERFKKDRKPIKGSVPNWLARARLLRNSIYEKMVKAYDVAKEKSWIRTPTPAERRRNLTTLDEMLRRWLDI